MEYNPAGPMLPPSPLQKGRGVPLRSLSHAPFSICAYLQLKLPAKTCSTSPACE
jgi:hypothetical protein